MAANGLHIRGATSDDAARLLRIYAPYVRETAVSFEMEPPTVDEFAARIEKALKRWQWLVAEIDGRCAGYAYGSMYRERAAYQWSCEVSAYVDPEVQGRGIGRRLYERLLPELAERGFCTAYAGIALPNDASIALHRAVGFEPIGVFRRAGRKFDRWHDVGWYQRVLRTEPPN
jgi:L-amino acid N-acyltransferase YncA